MADQPDKTQQLFDRMNTRLANKKAAEGLVFDKTSGMQPKVSPQDAMILKAREQGQAKAALSPQDAMIMKAREEQAAKVPTNEAGEVVGNPTEWEEKAAEAPERAWYNPVRYAAAAVDHVADSVKSQNSNMGKGNAASTNYVMKALKGEEISPEERTAAQAHPAMGFSTGDTAVKGGNAAVNIIGKAISPITKQTGKLFDAAAEKANYFTALKDMPEQARYEIERGLFKGEIGGSDRTAKHVHAAFAKATPEDQKAVYGFLTNAVSDPSVIGDASVRGAAEFAKGQIYTQGKKLVDQGVVSQEAFDKYAGEYLPRAYLKHIMDEGGKMPGSKLRMDRGYAHARNGDLTDEARAIMGEVKDPAYLAGTSMATQGRDIAVGNFLTKIADNPNWSLPNQFVEYNGKKIGAHQLLETAQDTLNNLSKLDPTTATAAAQHARDAMRIAENKIAELGNVDMSKYAQVPNSANYGDLRGMFVRKEIRDDLMGTAAQMHAPDAGVFEKLLNVAPGGPADRATNWWKMSKITLNIPTIARNFMSGGIMLHLSGMDAPVAKMADALEDYYKGGPTRKLAEKYGMDLSNFSSEEAATLIKQFRLTAADEKATGPISFMKLIGENPVAAAKVAGHKTVDGIQYTSNLYGKMETVMKMAKMKDVLEKGGTEEQAFLEAQKWLFDYSLSPKTQKTLRSNPVTGLPFSTFLYKAFPRVIEIAAKNPERLLPYAALPAMGEAYAKQQNGWTDKDVETYKSMLNEHIRDKSSVYLLPSKDGEGRPQFTDVGYITPWGSYLEMARQAKDGDMMKIMDGVGLLGMPLPQLAIALKTNRDPFTDREITTPTMSPAEQMGAIIKFAWNFAAPTMLSTHGFAGQSVTRATTDDKDMAANDRTSGQIATGLGGLNIYPVDIDKGIERLQVEQRVRKSELDKAQYSELKQARGGKEKKEIQDAYAEKRKARTEDGGEGREDLNNAHKLWYKEERRKLELKKDQKNGNPKGLDK